MKKRIKVMIVMLSLLLILVISIIIISLTKKPTENGTEFCTEESRNVDVCIEIYQPVCGYDSNGNKIQTYSNSCFACMNEEVKYYIDGQCP